MYNDLMITKKLPSGATCYIIPKKGYASVQCMVSVRYGAMDMSFTADGQRRDTPAGAAHFLEHKLFESAPGAPGVFETFARLGAEVNAFTTAASTAYYFMATSRAEDCLRALLDFVCHLHLTDENVEKEKGIITQEIRMYDDDPHWAAHFNLLEAVYAAHPARVNIAGTAESVASLTKETLTDCYDTFYRPSNMAVICAGDFADADALCDLIDCCIVRKEPLAVTRHYGDEPAGVHKEFAHCVMDVTRPIFSIGVKDAAVAQSPVDVAAMRVLLDLLCGESSALYADLFAKGWIDEGFYADYQTDADLGVSLFAGASDAPQKVYESILAEIARMQSSGVDLAAFERLKRKHIGRFWRGVNSLDAVVPAQCACFVKGTSLQRMLDAYMQLTREDIAARLAAFGGEKQTALSVVEKQPGSAPK